MALGGSLFRRHVTGCPHHAPGPCDGDTAIQTLGQAEVRDVRLLAGIKEDVLRLQVPVNDAALVCMIHGTGHLGQQQGRSLAIGSINR